MTEAETQEIKKIFAILAAYYRQPLEDMVIVMYAKDLAELDFQATVKALEQLRREKTRREVPMPADVFAIVQPKVSAKSLADDVANRIIAAFRRHGLAWTSGYVMNEITRYDSSTEEGLKVFETFPEAIIAEIGNVGWATIVRMGGYSSACREWSEANGGTFRAQLRDLVNSILEQSKAGKLNELPALPGTSQAKLIAQRHNPQLTAAGKETLDLQPASEILSRMKGPNEK